MDADASATEDPEIGQVRVISASKETDAHNVTLEILNEDHTLGNALRYAVAKDRATDFVGYSIPHPSENKMHLRVQTKQTGAESEAIPTTRRGVATLVGIYNHVLEQFDAEVERVDGEMKD